MEKQKELKLCPYCDGQILVLHDLLGLGQRARFVKVYAELDKVIQNAILRYRDEVKKGVFPNAETSYS